MKRACLSQNHRFVEKYNIHGMEIFQKSQNNSAKASNVRKMTHVYIGIIHKHRRRKIETEFPRSDTAITNSPHTTIEYKLQRLIYRFVADVLDTAVEIGRLAQKGRHILRGGQVKLWPLEVRRIRTRKGILTSGLCALLGLLTA